MWRSMATLGSCANKNQQSSSSPTRDMFLSGANPVVNMGPLTLSKKTTMFELDLGESHEPSGQGIGWWLACHAFEPSTTKEPPCREMMHVKSVESSNVLPLVWCGS
ncbi:hypothetical protein TNCV_185721 [Trichonephila clavipes]|nr:hypothetical protein TNCV_185721 [Trichonephila clavipes]